jgi:hypothetical protein
MNKHEIKYENMNEKVEMIKEKLKKKDIGVPFGISELTDGKKSNVIKMWIFKEVAVLGEG